VQDTDGRINTAVSGLERLGEMHNSFLQMIESRPGANQDAGVIGVSDGEITMNCLGVDLSVRHKFVVRNGLPATIEYSFLAKYRDDELLIFNMYLEPNGVVYVDLNAETRLCDFNNTYISKIVLYKVAEMLLDSEVFAPTIE